MPKLNLQKLKAYLDTMPDADRRAWLAREAATPEDARGIYSKLYPETADPKLAEKPQAAVPSAANPQPAPPKSFMDRAQDALTYFGREGVLKRAGAIAGGALGSAAGAAAGPLAPVAIPVLAGLGAGVGEAAQTWAGNKMGTPGEEESVADNAATSATFGLAGPVIGAGVGAGAKIAGRAVANAAGALSGPLERMGAAASKAALRLAPLGTPPGAPTIAQQTLGSAGPAMRTAGDALRQYAAAKTSQTLGQDLLEGAAKGYGLRSTVQAPIYETPGLEDLGSKYPEAYAMLRSSLQSGPEAKALADTPNALQSMSNVQRAGQSAVSPVQAFFQQEAKNAKSAAAYPEKLSQARAAHRAAEETAMQGYDLAEDAAKKRWLAENDLRATKASLANNRAAAALELESANKSGEAAATMLEVQKRAPAMAARVADAEGAVMGSEGSASLYDAMLQAQIAKAQANALASKAGAAQAQSVEAGAAKVTRLMPEAPEPMTRYTPGPRPATRPFIPPSAPPEGPYRTGPEYAEIDAILSALQEGKQARPLISALNPFKQAEMRGLTTELPVLLPKIKGPFRAEAPLTTYRESLARQLERNALEAVGGDTRLLNPQALEAVEKGILRAPASRFARDLPQSYAVQRIRPDTDKRGR